MFHESSPSWRVFQSTRMTCKNITIIHSSECNPPYSCGFLLRRILHSGSGILHLRFKWFSHSRRIKRFSFPTWEEERMFDTKSVFYRMELQLIAIQNLRNYNSSHAYTCTTMGLGILKRIKFIFQTLELSKFIFSHSSRIYIRCRLSLAAIHKMEENIIFSPLPFTLW